MNCSWICLCRAVFQTDVVGQRVESWLLTSSICTTRMWLMTVMSRAARSSTRPLTAHVTGWGLLLRHTSSVYKCLNGSGSAYLTDGLRRVSGVKSRWSSSSSTLVVPVTRRATLGVGRPGMERSTRLRHSSANHFIITHCDLFSRTCWHWQHVIFLTL